MMNTQRIKVYTFSVGVAVLKIAFNSIYNTVTSIVFIDIPVSAALNKYQNMSVPLVDYITNAFEDNKLYEVNIPKYLSRSVVSGSTNEIAKAFGVQDNLWIKLAIASLAGAAGAYSKISVKDIQQEKHAGEVAVYSNQIIYEICNRFEKCADPSIINTLVTISNEIMESVSMEASINSAMEGAMIGAAVVGSVGVLSLLELSIDKFTILTVAISVIEEQTKILDFFVGDNHTIYNISSYLE